MAYEKTKLMNLEDGQEVLRSIDTKLGGYISNLKNEIDDVPAMAPFYGSLSGKKIIDTEPYLFRQCKDGIRETEKLIGGTVAWNQLVQHGNFDATTGWGANSGATFSISNNVATVVGNALYDCMYQQIPNVKDHVYLITCESGTSDVANSRPLAYYKSGWNYVVYDGTASKRYSAIFKSNNTTTSQQARFGAVVGSASVTMTVKNANVFDLTQMFGSTIADAIYAMEQATAGSGVAWFRSLFPKDYYAYNAGELMSVQAGSKVTTGFNQWDEEWEVGGYWSNGSERADENQARAKNYIPVLPNTTYATNKGIAFILYFDSNKNLISVEAENTLTKQFITPSNCRYVKFSVAKVFLPSWLSPGWL